MKELGHLKTYKMKLTTLSPVFIGDGTAINDIKNEEDFRKTVLRNDPNRMREWIDYFMNFKKYRNNHDKRIPKDAKSPSLQGFLRFIGEKVSDREKDFIKIDGVYKIPGSSIKGAIRTALLADEIEKNGKDFKKAEDEIKKQMQYISVSDSEEISPNDFYMTDIIPQKIIHDFSKGYSNNFKMNKQFLHDDVTTYFVVTVDKKRLKYTIDDILRILENHYSKVIEEHSKALKSTDVNVYDDYIGLKPNINIGGQSGFNTKVVLRSLAKDYSDYIRQKKETLDQKFKNKSHNSPDIPTAPRYLKYVKEEFDDENVLLTIGWCNISEVK